MPRHKFRELREQYTADPHRAELFEQAKRQMEAELAAYGQGLAELRRARAFTQEQLAKTLDVSQAQVSRIEHQTDLYLSTLQGYLEALGGRLELVGVFNDHRIVLSLNDLTESDAEPTGETTAIMKSALVP